MGRKSKNQRDVPSSTKSISTMSQVDDSELDELCSVGFSSCTGDFDGSQDGTEDGYPTRYINLFGTCVDEISDKNARTRIQAMKTLSNLLKKSIVDESDWEKYRSTLMDAIEKNLRRSDEEVLIAATIIALIAIQTSGEFEEDLIESVKLLKQIVANYSKSDSLRATAAQALGVTIYFSFAGSSEVSSCVDVLYRIWSSTDLSATSSTLFTAALESWCLLLFQSPQVCQDNACNNDAVKLCKFLEASNVDVRVAVGQVLSNLYQLGQSNDDEFEFKDHEDLEVTLRELAADYAKYRAKRDKRLQKFTFRQVIDVIYNDSYPRERISFNKNGETLILDDCHGRLVYDCLCHVLTGDVCIHLGANQIVRDTFDLGPPQLIMKETVREKQDRKLMQNMKHKMRTIVRGKQKQRWEGED